MRRFLALLFGDDGAVADRPSTGFADHQLAAAALMVEAARLDGAFEHGERLHIRRLLAERFALPPDLAEELLAHAEHAAADDVAWQDLTRRIKEALEPEERIEIIEMLWEVAYADGELHDYEASLLRRVAGLLYVGDRESGEARQRVLARLRAGGH